MFVVAIAFLFVVGLTVAKIKNLKYVLVYVKYEGPREVIMSALRCCIGISSGFSDSVVLQLLRQPCSHWHSASLSHPIVTGPGVSFLYHELQLSTLKQLPELTLIDAQFSPSPPIRLQYLVYALCLTALTAQMPRSDFQVLSIWR